MEDYSISKENALLLEAAWTNMRGASSEATVEVKDVWKDRSLTFKLAQGRNGGQVYTMFMANRSNTSEWIADLYGINGVRVCETDRHRELIVESNGVSIAFRVRDE